MSEFSGTCDVCDHFLNKSDEEIRSKSFFIVTEDGRTHRLKINNRKDLAMYYPYHTKCCFGDLIFLSDTCFIDREEREFITLTYNLLLKYYNKCKRKKIPFLLEDAHEKERLIGWCRECEDWEIELFNRIKNDGSKATITGLHTPMQDSYRKTWYEHLVQIGHNEKLAKEWVYGWERTYK